MKYRVNYKCDNCHSTKTILIDTERMGHAPGDNDIPLTVPCGFHGCNGPQKLVEAKKKNITVENIPKVILDPDFTPK